MNQSHLVQIIISDDPAVRDRSLESFCDGADAGSLLSECAALDAFRRESNNLYEQVRALFFLEAIHRFHLPVKAGVKQGGLIPFEGYEHLLRRRFEEAIDLFLDSMDKRGHCDGISSALAAAYHGLGFQTLANQVRRSVRSVRGNQWMFRMGHPLDQPLRIRRELAERTTSGLYPILHETTPVRMDLTHSAWSDIFFLGMDFPEGARVLNISVDLGVHGRDPAPRPPVEVFLRIIDEPLLRLTSVDLNATADIVNLAEVFDFAKDYLGLLKAAVIASGIVPPGIEGSGQSLAALLATMVGEGRGLELVSSVNNIPKGSRLAVSTNLLACLISACMRATGQAKSLTGSLDEPERRLVAARAILGEWLGGSGGGWQDSGGVWPGIKLITGEQAREGDPESGVSRGRLMPRHHLLGTSEISADSRRKLQESLVLVHGGMAQNVGPILEMVTEKYLLRSAREWAGRQEALTVLDEILVALRVGDIRAVGAATTRNFFGPLQTIIPWAGNLYTETLIQKVRSEFGADFHGFWMLGGMSGGGMGFIFNPARREEGQERLLRIMGETKRELEHSLPFAMEPVVYDFAINEQGTFGELLDGASALMPPGYYPCIVPRLLRADPRGLPPARRAELDLFSAACRSRGEFGGTIQSLFEGWQPHEEGRAGKDATVQELLNVWGFDNVQHEQIRADLKNGRIGLAQNRLPVSAAIQDVEPGDVFDATAGNGARDFYKSGIESLAAGELAVVSLAAGAGSRWTQGAGVVKALHPFCKLGGRHRTFIETHLAKSRRISRIAGATIPHIFTTGYLTHEPIARHLEHCGNYGYPGRVLLSPGRSVGLRMVPAIRDLRFAWEEMPQQLLDAQQQKMRESLRAALIQWAGNAGETSDYTDNVPLQCLHPVGHWFEVPNLLRNGVLAGLLKERPSLKYLLLHNIDTLGADPDPAMLGLHRHLGGGLTFEVITRRIDDRGGGLARVNGRVRLVEGLVMPHERDEFRLSYYNSMTTWITVDRLLEAFGLGRGDLTDAEKVKTAVRNFGARLPTYITLKDVKKRWGHGQEDVFPVAQFEKLWGDMSSLADIASRFVVVPRKRGQQLKDQAQLDGWLRDGSAAAVEALCEWE